jgi:Ca2+-binding RTX toxin-like protein
LRKRSALAVALLALAVPSSAAADATVSYVPGTGLVVNGGEGNDSIVVGIAGSDGQDHQSAAPPRVYIVFGGSGIVAGAGCTMGTARPSGLGGQEVAGARCTLRDPPGPGDADIAVNAGGGDDFVGLSNFTFFGLPNRATTDLGAGNDTAIGANTDDTIRGGDGNDSIKGWDGNDLIDGGAGNDTMSPGLGVNTVLGDAGDDQLVQTEAPHGVTTGSDDFSGGTGTDLVSYRERTVPVVVTRGGADGQAGENDTIRNDVERLVGGQANDALELSGTTDAGSIAGGPGDDVLSASSTVLVTITGDAGTDTVKGGNGPNVVNMRDGVPERVSCGGGRDTLDADLKDSLPTDCEQVVKAALLEGPNVAIRTTRARAGRDGRIGVTLRCPAALGSMGCTGTLRVAGRGKGPRTKYSIRAGRSRVVRSRLSAADAGRLRRAGRVLRVESVEAGALGDKTTIAPITVLPPR